MEYASNNNPLISVMILCYNYSDMLQKSLAACARQTFSDFEVVLINNGSTDNTEAVFFDFCKHHPHIRTQYVHIKENRGPTHGWNTGLQYANGEYLMFHDADDWMEPNCLELLAKTARQTGAHRIIGQYQEVTAAGKVARVRNIPRHPATVLTPMLQGTLFKKSVITANGLTFLEGVTSPYDYAFTYAFSLHENTVPAYVRTTVYNYYINPVSVTQEMQKSSNAAKILTGYLQIIQISADACDKAERAALKNEIEYLCVKNTYANVLFQFRFGEKEMANDVCQKTMACLRKHFPCYKKNPLIYRVNNGYSVGGNLFLRLLLISEKTHTFQMITHLVARFL